MSLNESFNFLLSKKFYFFIVSQDKNTYRKADNDVDGFYKVGVEKKDNVDLYQVLNILFFGEYSCESLYYNFVGKVFKL